MKTYNCFLILLVFWMNFSCSSEPLPVLNIKKNEKIGWNKKEPCVIVYSTNMGEETLLGKIKCRGGMSSRYAKHSYALELDTKYPLAGLPKDDDWIINANYIDKTFMRHKISYDLFREMDSINVASRSSYINVSLNDLYNGLFVLMEETNASMIGLNKTDSMAMLFKDPPIFSRDRITLIQDSSNYYQQKFPKIGVVDKTMYIEKFKDFLFNSSNQEFSDSLELWVDISNIVDWHIMLLFSNNSDGIMKNFYLYKLDKNTPFRIAIWDYDHSFGRDGDNERNLMERELDCQRSILLKRLSNIAELGYKKRLKTRWVELREKNVISISNFEKHISINNELIKGHVEKNFQLWPVNDKWYFDDKSYHSELELMREFVALRIEYLDNYFEIQ